jgi:toxin ParE1/3/4
VKRVVLSPQTERDLEEIGDYIARDNPRRAVTFIAEVKSKCLSLGHAPGIGAPRPELGEGVRMLPHGRYLIFYRAHDAMIRIERVMHGARDIGSDDFDADV